VIDLTSRTRCAPSKSMVSRFLEEKWNRIAAREQTENLVTFFAASLESVAMTLANAQ
jgi:hypothetical protein